MCVCVCVCVCMCVCVRPGLAGQAELLMTMRTEKVRWGEWMKESSHTVGLCSNQGRRWFCSAQTVNPMRQKAFLCRSARDRRSFMCHTVRSSTLMLSQNNLWNEIIASVGITCDETCSKTCGFFKYSRKEPLLKERVILYLKKKSDIVVCISFWLSWQ